MTPTIPQSPAAQAASYHPTALISGGSSGIGLELAKLFARDGYRLVLVAHNEAKLAAAAGQLRASYGVDVRTVSQDLSVAGAAQQVADQVVQLGIAQVDALVNDAGFGLIGRFVDLDWNKQHEMLTTNIDALCELSYIYGAQMAGRRNGHILNVASIAAFMPGPYMAVYYASKAFVESFSQALYAELRPYGVRVSVVCPPPAKTQFFTRAGYGAKSLFQYAAMSPQAVARAGYRALKMGRAQCSPGVFTKVTELFARAVPISVMRTIIAALQNPTMADAHDARGAK